MNNAENVTADALLNILCPMFTQFAAVARERQITKAASALDVPQPTVTRHLARLENVLGVRLCKRVQGGIALTPEGERLVDPVEEALGLLAQAIDRLDSSNVLQRISFGFSTRSGRRWCRRCCGGLPRSIPSSNSRWSRQARINC
jgi:DNA-binding transcriptional LysR family regulator